MASIKIANKNFMSQSGTDEPAITSNVTIPASIGGSLVLVSTTSLGRSVLNVVAITYPFCVSTHGNLKMLASVNLYGSTPFDSKISTTLTHLGFIVSLT